MSHSYRRPYASVCGPVSAADDKRLARQGVRRVQNQVLRSALKHGLFEDLLLPHKLECPWNETYQWNRDGGKHYYGDYKNKVDNWPFDPGDHLNYYLKLCRK